VTGADTAVPRTPRAYLRWLSGQVGPSGLKPVLVLMYVAGVERFGVQAVSILGPNIRDAFHISNQTLVTVVGLAAILPALLSPWIGYLADRVDRVRLAQLGTLAVGIVAIGLGLAPTFAVFGVLAVVAGIGQLVNIPTHSSLITDYYPPEALGTTFTFYLFATSAIGLTAAVAGVVGQVAGWRVTFALIAVPTLIGLWLLGLTRDPGRGASIGLRLEREEKANFWEGFRRVAAVRSLRRTWWASVFFGGGLAAIGPLQSVFFKDVYHYGTAARGALTTLFGLGGLIGTIIGGRLVQVRLRRSQPEFLAVINGLMVVEFGIGILLMGLLPWAWGSIVMLFALAIGVAGFLPAYNAMIGLVTTPRLRGQAFSYSLIFTTAGAIVIAPIVGAISNHHERAAMWVLGALMMMAGLIEVTARQFIDRDVVQARTSREASEVGSLLAVRGLEVAYGGNVQILFGVDLDVNEGEVVALLGTNGAGKSTLLRAVSGLIDPIGGAVFFDGRDVTHADAVTKARLGIALVPGDRGVFPGLTVADNLRIATWMFRGDTARVEQVTERVLSYFPVLRQRLKVQAGDMSGGEQQMLVLAQALMGEPKILMIDELSLGLAPIVVGQLLDRVRALAAAGITILLVEQSVNLALTVAQRAVFMEKGEIRFSGPTAELLDRPDVLRAVFLEGAASSGAGTVAATPSKRGRATKASRPVLEVVDVSKRFGGVMANEQVSLTLNEGQILGILGPNGAGKTTLFDLISGFLPADGGRIFLHGIDVTEAPPDERARLGLGRSFQDSRLFPALTVADTIRVAFERHLAVGDPVAAALNLPAVVEAEADIDERVQQLVETLGLAAFANKFVSEISTGTRRMVDLACILAHRPSVILFDEPSSGIAQRETEALGPVLRRVRELTGSSLLVIEHDMPLLTGLADEIVALHLGGVLTTGRPDEVIHDPRVVAAYLGTSVEAVARSGELVGALPGRAAGNGAGGRRRARTNGS
jgi:ABC-type branched-subunit amino acid transport system ATPase component/predicted MFS family arabinose efflux permease